MEELNTNEKRFLQGNVKIIANLLIVVIVASILLLLNFFVLDDFGASMVKDVNYWLAKALMGAGTFAIMIGLANSTEEKLRMKDKTYLNKIKSLDAHYNLVMQNGETDYVDMFLSNINRASKYSAYIKKQKAKLQKLYRLEVKYKEHKKIKLKLEKKIDELEKSLLLSVNEVWALEYPKVKYPKLSFTKLTSGAISISEHDDYENDLDVHRADAVARKLVWKALIIIGSAMFLPELIFHFNDFTRDDVIPLLFRIFSILWSIYTGISFGFYMNDRVIVSLKKKLKKFSEFRVRTDKEEYKNLAPEVRYSININIDGLVRKLYAEHNIKLVESDFKGIKVETKQLIKESTNTSENAITKTLNDIEHPMSPGALATNLINNIIEQGGKELQENAK